MFSGDVNLAWVQLAVMPAGLWVAVAVVLAACVIYVLVRGVWRLVLNTVLLAAAAVAGFYVWQQGPGWAFQWLGSSPRWMTWALPLGVFVSVWWLLRRVIALIADLISGEGEGGGSWLAVPARLVVAFGAAAVFCLLGAILLHHFGAIEEVRWHSDPEADAGKWAGFLASGREVVGRLLPADWLDKLDPQAAPGRVELVKWIMGGGESEVIDPVTGKPVPRAVLVDEKTLGELAAKGDISTLLRHPAVTRIVEDPRVKAWLDALKH